MIVLLENGKLCQVENKNVKRSWENVPSLGGERYCIGLKLLKNVDELMVNKYILDTNNDCYGFFARDGYLYRTLCGVGKHDCDSWADQWEKDYVGQEISLLVNGGFMKLKMMGPW